MASSARRRNDRPRSKVHVANTGPTWVLLAPDGPYVGPLNLAIRDDSRAMYISFSDTLIIPTCKIHVTYNDKRTGFGKFQTLIYIFFLDIAHSFTYHVLASKRKHG